MLLESLVDWMIEKFNRVSNNYRMVARTLEEEMKAQKALIQVSHLFFWSSLHHLIVYSLPDTM